MVKTNTIRLHFWLPFVIFLAFTIFLISFSYIQYNDYHTNIERSRITAVQERLTEAANKLERLYDNHVNQLVPFEIADINIRNDVKAVALVNENGIVLYSSFANWNGLPLTNIATSFDPKVYKTTQLCNRQQMKISNDRNHIYAYEPILLSVDSNEIRSKHIGVLFVDFDITKFKSEQITILLIRTFLVWAIGLLFIIFVSIILHYWLSLPFKAFKNSIKQFGEGDYEARIQFSGNGEFVAIGNTFNHMADEVMHNRDQLTVLLDNEIKLKIQLLEAKANAEESDKLKSAFLANMSHEIRTPMNGILGFTELLKCSNVTPEDQAKYIKIIEASGHRMLNIINDIIDISKIESGLMKIFLSESNINDQIDFIYSFFKLEIEQKGITLNYKKSLPRSESTVKSDHDKIYAILINLVKNAIKYSRASIIDFGYDLKFVSIGDEPALNAELEFYVKDNGVGIPKDRHEAIFERFIQADIADKMAIQGAGLGLSIAKAYVDMLGGRIWVESEMGSGASFYFTIPYITCKERSNVVQQKTGIMSQNDVKDLQILIAEDDSASEMLISIAIKSFCKNVITVKTGVEAIYACEHNPNIDLILMDIKMPEMNGYDATKKIREFNKEVIIIAQTAFGLSGDKEKAIEAGCNDYISKPIKQSDLKGLVEKYFG